MAENTKVGRKAGEGAIVCGSEKYGEFAKIWNSSQESSEQLTITKKNSAGETVKVEASGRIVGIIKALRAAKIADDKTDPSQVRAFATKVRDSGHNLTVFAVRLDRKIVVRAWQTSNSPSEAFEKAVQAGLFGSKEFASEDERKAKLASFRACVQQLKKSGVGLKEMGRKRADRIKDADFIKAWNSSETVAEVKDKLVEEGIIKEDFKLSSLKSKYKTLLKTGVELKKLKSGEQINDLRKLAALLAENPDADIPDDEDEDDEDEDVDDEDDVDEDADVDDDDLEGYLDA